MRKADLITMVSEVSGIPKVDVLVILDTFFAEVKASLVMGEPVYVRGFGSFILKKRAARPGRNIKNNTSIQLSEQYIPFFKPGKEFMQAIKKSK